jgi:hypothetical protein
MPFYTRAVAGSATPSRGVPRTHAVDDVTGAPLCRVRPASILLDDDATNPHAAPTCPTCANRDPRGRSGGPFALTSMLQF